MTVATILESVRVHWRDLRGRTYDLMDALEDADLEARLPFPESQDVFYQLRCMLGSQESWAPVLLEGRMRGWACSLDAEADARPTTVARVRSAMEAADGRLDEAFRRADWLRVFKNGNTPLAGYYRLVEHESHHHGQLINLIYGCGFPIPESWTDAWGLSRE